MNNDIDYLNVYCDLGYTLVTTDNFNSKGYLNLVSRYIVNLRMFNNKINGDQINGYDRLR